MSPKPLVVLGGGGHARVVADAAEAAGLRVAGLLDPGCAAGSRVGRWEVLGSDALLDDAGFLARHAFVPGFGDAALRRRLALLVREKGGELGRVVHPRAVVAVDVQLAGGSVVFAGAVLNPGCAVGAFAVINTAASVDHDGVLADGVHVGPGAHLAGRIRCEEDVSIGTGAVVAPGLRIGARAVVGAGAVVIRDVPAGATVVGCPARVLRRA